MPFLAVVAAIQNPRKQQESRKYSILFFFLPFLLFVLLL
jgi:hypothetical protein